MKKAIAVFLLFSYFVSVGLAGTSIYVPAGIKSLSWTRPGGCPNKLSETESVNVSAQHMPKIISPLFLKDVKIDLANDNYKIVWFASGAELSFMEFDTGEVRGPVYCDFQGEQKAKAFYYTWVIEGKKYDLTYLIFEKCGNHAFILRISDAPVTPVPTKPTTPVPSPSVTPVPTQPTPGPDPNQPTKAPTTPPTEKPTEPGLVIGEKNYQGSCRKNELPPGNYSAMPPDEYDVTNHIEGTVCPSVTPTGSPIPPIDPNCPPTAVPSVTPVYSPTSHPVVTPSAIPTGGPVLTVTPVPTTQPVVVVTQIPVPTPSQPPPVQGGQQPVNTPVIPPPHKIGGDG